MKNFLTAVLVAFLLGLCTYSQAQDLIRVWNPILGKWVWVQVPPQAPPSGSLPIYGMDAFGRWGRQSTYEPGKGDGSLYFPNR